METYGLKEFIDFVKKEYGCDVSVNEKQEPDTFEKIFGGNFISGKEQAVLSDTEKMVNYSNRSMSLEVELSALFDLSDCPSLDHAA